MVMEGMLNRAAVLTAFNYQTFSYLVRRMLDVTEKGLEVELAEGSIQWRAVVLALLNLHVSLYLNVLADVEM